MKILMISLDKKILEHNSAVQKRHFEYGGICDELCIVVLGNAGAHGMEHENTRKKIPLAPFAKGGIGGNVKIYTAGGKNKISRFFKACVLAGEIVKKNKIDLVTTQDAAYAGLIGYCLNKKFKIKLNVQIHGLEEKFLNKILFLSLKRKIIKSADSVRVVSERMRRWVMRKYKVDNSRIFKISVYSELELRIKNQESGIKNQQLINENIKKLEIGNCLPAEVSAQVGKLGDKFIILTVGRLVKVKNIGLQIKAVADVIKMFPNIRLVIAGDGAEKKNLEELASRLKLNDIVEFSGWQENLKPYYENADLFLLTSNSEGWGMAVIDAMASAVPVIMTDVGCAGEVVKNNENGIVIRKGDKNRLVAAISEIIADKEKREVFSKKGRATVMKLPNKEETMEMYGKMWKFRN
ncbi:MAG: glycosyltransferase family 4 protein [bacterium]